MARTLLGRRPDLMYVMPRSVAGEAQISDDGDAQVGDVGGGEDKR